jgi:hypothetical protein
LLLIKWPPSAKRHRLDVEQLERLRLAVVAVLVLLLLLLLLLLFGVRRLGLGRHRAERATRRHALAGDARALQTLEHAHQLGIGAHLLLDGGARLGVAGGAQQTRAVHNRLAVDAEQLDQVKVVVLQQREQLVLGDAHVARTLERGENLSGELLRLVRVIGDRLGDLALQPVRVDGGRIDFAVFSAVVVGGHVLAARSDGGAAVAHIAGVGAVVAVRVLGAVAHLVGGDTFVVARIIIIVVVGKDERDTIVAVDRSRVGAVATRRTIDIVDKVGDGVGGGGEHGVLLVGERALKHLALDSTTLVTRHDRIVLEAKEHLFGETREHFVRHIADERSNVAQQVLVGALSLFGAWHVGRAGNVGGEQRHVCRTLLRTGARRFAAHTCLLIGGAFAHFAHCLLTHATRTSTVTKAIVCTAPKRFNFTSSLYNKNKNKKREKIDFLKRKKRRGVTCALNMLESHHVNGLSFLLIEARDSNSIDTRIV